MVGLSAVVDCNRKCNWNAVLELKWWIEVNTISEMNGVDQQHALAADTGFGRAQ